MDKPQPPPCLGNISVVLTRTSHPANIGSAARAMKTMGIIQMILVSPNLMVTSVTPEPSPFDPTSPGSFKLPEESFILAAGAADVLENVKVFATLKDALAEQNIACALTSRKRELTAALHTPRELAPEIINHAQNGQKVALVFGNETFGLSIEEVLQCNRLMTINGNPDYFSLNLAQAVQVISYEIFSHIDLPLTRLEQAVELANRAQVEGMVRHMEDVMQNVGFFERRNEVRLMRRMQRLFDRANVEREEIDILRGFFKQIEKSSKSS